MYASVGWNSFHQWNSKMATWIRKCHQSVHWAQGRGANGWNFGFRCLWHIPAWKIKTCSFPSFPFLDKFCRLWAVVDLEGNILPANHESVVDIRWFETIRLLEEKVTIFSATVKAEQRQLKFPSSSIVTSLCTQISVRHKKPDVHHSLIPI